MNKDRDAEIDPTYAPWAPIPYDGESREASESRKLREARKLPLFNLTEGMTVSQAYTEMLIELTTRQWIDYLKAHDAWQAWQDVLFSVTGEPRYDDAEAYEEAYEARHRGTK